MGKVRASAQVLPQSVSSDNIEPGAVTDNHLATSLIDGKFTFEKKTGDGETASFVFSTTPATYNAGAGNMKIKGIVFLNGQPCEDMGASGTADDVTEFKYSGTPNVIQFGAAPAAGDSIVAMFITTSGTGSESVFGKSRVSSDDAGSDFLFAKLKEGTNISLSVSTVDGVEQVQISTTGVQKTITVSGTAPSNPSVGDLWVDTSA